MKEAVKRILEAAQAAEDSASELDALMAARKHKPALSDNALHSIVLWALASLLVFWIAPALVWGVLLP